MSRRPKPNHLHLVQGTGRKSRHSLADAPRPPTVESAPAAPEHLSRYAREAWEQIAPIVFRMGVLSPADAKAFERLCECYHEIRECRFTIEMAGGPTYETRSVTGELMYRSRPEVAMLADADRRFKGYLVEFGLTPAARTKVKVDGARAVDPIDAYFAG